ncbi:hypothetical protein GCK72_004767 [Caenorhabditis remanei]|uniref:Poly(A) polymerase n=1 Tax=Caenorhabditis remanei TaxID=31234 RepID=A0A6A5HCB2_CAERE|nr:hypothetical protein GCK72_004767 [Caenorhabditis remanei]KAF1764817.1 hypothetical protein GCK72_004767 [Caenorhabditis remanei]
MSSTKILGVSQPISMAAPSQKDIQLNNSLNEYLQTFKCFESKEETCQRVKTLSKLNLLVKKWIKSLADVRIPNGRQVDAGGKLMTFGSYRLGVHSSGADIDTVIIAPRHVTRMDFFTSFKQILMKNPNVKELQAVENAFVPILTMTYSGIELDVLFARLDKPTIPENIDLSDDSLLVNLDESSIRSLNGIRVAEQLLKLVPNRDTFCQSLRAIKLWAKNHGVYSNAMGFFGGITWAILVARTCQLYPNAAPSKIIQKVFFVFSTWKWPFPVVLKQFGCVDSKLANLVWNPRKNLADRYHLMPILTPTFPEQNSTHNVSKSTLHIIQEEMKSALEICDQIQKGNATWNDLFEEINFFSRYKHFVALTINEDTNIGFFESKIRQLVQIIERNSQVKTAHINPRKLKNIRNESTWFLGLEFTENAKNLDLTSEIEGFKRNMARQQAKGIVGQIQLDATYVKRSDLIKFISLGDLKRGRFVKSKTAVNRKRPASSGDSTETKKPRVIDMSAVDSVLLKLKSNQ